MQPEAVRLNELRLLGWERRLEAWLALGRHAAAAAELESLVGEHPLRERLWAMWMIALYRGGRQADALRAFQRCRRTLDEELGLQPGPSLRRLEQAIVCHEPLDDLIGPVPTAAPAVAVSPVSAPAARGAPADGDDEDTGAVSRREAPMVGRAAPLRRLVAQLSEAAAGRGGLALIEGEAGIGKTRLAEELATAAEAQGMAVAWGHADETGGAPPFWPWVQVVRSLGGDAGPRGSSLTELLGDRLAASDVADDPSAARFRLNQAMVDLLVDAAAKQPLLVVLDDLQWADASSRHFLQFLAGELARVPLLVLATFRPAGDAGPGLEELLGALARVRNCERIQLLGLSVGEVERYLELTAGRGGPTPGLAAALHARTDGNPFFLTELLRLLTSEKTVDQLGVAEAFTLDVPGSVRDVILRRLDRLPEDTQTLLRVAVVIGREFDLDLLEHVSGVDGERLMTLIEPPLLTGLVTESDETWSCRFSHALVQETLYRSMSRLQRARLHRRVGEALETLCDGAVEGHLDQLAHHFHAARTTGTASKAVDYGRQAAEAAGRNLAHDEAVGHWARALGALDASVPDAARHRYEILLGLGEARREALAAQAVALARPIADPALIGRVLNNAFIALWTPDREAERRAVADEALAWAGRGPPRDTEVIARLHCMWSLLRQGELDSCDAELATCRRLADEVRIPEIAGQVLMGETGRAILDGRWGEAEELAAAAFARLSATTVWGAHWCRTVQLYTMRREQGRLGELLAELLALCDEPGGEPLRPTAVLTLAELGDHDEARRRIDRWGTARPFDWSWDFLTAQWAAIAAALGQPDPEALYQDLLPRAELLVVAGTGNTTWGSTHLVLGRLALRLGRCEVALGHFEAAVSHNRRVGARPFEARARFELARLRRELGGLGGTELEELLEPARRIAAQVGMAALAADLAELAR